jgi:hypothetical protein
MYQLAAMLRNKHTRNLAREQAVRAMRLLNEFQKSLSYFKQNRNTRANKLQRDEMHEICNGLLDDLRVIYNNTINRYHSDFPVAAVLRMVWCQKEFRVQDKTLIDQLTDGTSSVHLGNKRKGELDGVGLVDIADAMKRFKLDDGLAITS